MSRVSRMGLGFLALLVLGFILVLADGLGGEPAPELALLGRVTGLGGPAFATGYLERSRPPFADHADVVHPGLPPVNRLDLIYAPR